MNMELIDHLIDYMTSSELNNRPDSDSWHAVARVASDLINITMYIDKYI